MEDRVNKLEKFGLLSPLTSESYPVCESCLQGKMTKLPFVEHGERAIDLLALVIRMCVAHLMCRLEAVMFTSLPLSMICLGTCMCF